MSNTTEVLKSLRQGHFTPKRDLILAIHEQLEAQVQFGDSKTSVLIGVNTFLLGVVGAFMQFGLKCTDNRFSWTCFSISPKPLAAAAYVMTACASALIVGLLLALIAARPGRIHRDPPRDLSLFSYIAKRSKDLYALELCNISEDELLEHVVHSIWGKSSLAAKKFLILRLSLNATLLAVGLLVSGVAIALAS